MDEPASTLLYEADRRRDQAKRAVRLSLGMSWADQLRLIKYAEQMTEQADELERQAAVKDPGLRR